MPRVRIRHSKTPLLQYTGTLDIQKLWERTFRRAGLPVEYSQGFHPQPKIQLACPLPLGMTSQAEYVDFWLEQPYKLAELREKIEAAKHEGIDILEIGYVDGKEPSLQSRVLAMVYSVRLDNTIGSAEIEPRLGALLVQSEIILERRGRQYNLRPLIEDCAFSQSPDGTLEIRMTLSARSGATGRPEEVLKALEIDPNSAHISREELIFQPLPE